MFTLRMDTKKNVISKNWTLFVNYYKVNSIGDKHVRHNLVQNLSLKNTTCHF